MPRSRLAAMLLAVVLCGLSGCGEAPPPTLTQVHDFSPFGGRPPASARQSEGPSGAQLWSKFQTQLAACTSVRIASTAVVNKVTETSTLSGTCDGANSWAQFAAESRSLEIFLVSGTYYIKANTAFWMWSEVPKNVIVSIGTKYLASTDRAKFDYYTTGHLMADLRNIIQSVGGADLVVQKTTLDGKSVYELVRGSRSSPTTVKVWITEQAGTLMKFSYEGPGGTLECTFSDWNAIAPFAAPPPAQVAKF